MAQYSKCNVKYCKGNVHISVEQIDGFGKNPGLWIGTEDPNMREKVASFGSQDKADTFCKWLDYLLGCGQEVKRDAAD